VTSAVLLGNAQDAGLPQAGCGCAHCAAAWADPSLRRCATALGLLDPAEGVYFLIDATPDFREQLHRMQALAPAARLGGVLLTHAHLGHYTGLLQLGFEAMNTHGLPLFATRRMLDFLAGNAPWRMLLERGNVAPREITPGDWWELTPALSALAVLVPHRGEWSDTVGFMVRGPRRQLLYVPDIDDWDDWAGPPFGRDLRATVEGVDAALLDGTFFSAGELPGRDVRGIGHPLVTDTAARLRGTRAAVSFIHLNHSNPLHRAGPERAWLEAQGLAVADEGTTHEL
jgi:pyrroloquinoline quinone biosynthesis protein B